VPCCPSRCRAPTWRRARRPLPAFSLRPSLAASTLPPTCDACSRRACGSAARRRRALL